MNIKKHIEKAERLETTLKKLDIESDWESIVEIAYGNCLKLHSSYLRKETK